MQQIEKSCSKLIAKIEECDIITKQAKAERQRLRTKRGDMAQLVERRVRNAKARGSNPLISTKNLAILCNGVARFFLQGDLAQLFELRTRRLPCEPLRADACAITKASRSAFYESPYLHQSEYKLNPLNLYSFFMLFGGGLKFYDAIKRLVDKYACNFVVTRNSR